MTDEPSESNPPYNFPTTVDGFADVACRCFSRTTWKEEAAKFKAQGMSEEDIYNERTAYAAYGAMILGFDLEEDTKKYPVQASPPPSACGVLPVEDAAMTDKPAESNAPCDCPTTLEGFADVACRTLSDTTWKADEDRIRSLGASKEEIFEYKVKIATAGVMIFGLDLEEAIKKL